jgi:hypothetical protein
MKMMRLTLAEFRKAIGLAQGRDQLEEEVNLRRSHSVVAVQARCQPGEEAQKERHADELPTGVK